MDVKLIFLQIGLNYISNCYSQIYSQIFIPKSYMNVSSIFFLYLNQQIIKCVHKCVDDMKVETPFMHKEVLISKVLSLDNMKIYVFVKPPLWGLLRKHWTTIKDSVRFWFHLELAPFIRKLHLMAPSLHSFANNFHVEYIK